MELRPFDDGSVVEKQTWEGGSDLDEGRGLAMKPEKAGRAERDRGADRDSGREPAFPGWRAKALRKAWAKQRRHEKQSERARVRDEIHARMHDPDSLDELSGMRRIRRKSDADKALKRELMLHARRRRVHAELKATKDVAGFIEGLGRSRTVYSLIAMDFFRHVLNSPTYGDDSRFKQGILGALEDPGLAKVIRHKWEAFDREFPGQSAA